MKVLGDKDKELLRALDVHGRIGDFVVKHYGDKIVICARPRKSTKPPTEHQQKTKARFKKAVEYAREVLKDPAQIEKYSNRREGRSVYNAAVSDYLKNM